MTKVFVFGSNREGRHGAGAALTAKNFWGAVYGQPRGIQGQSYAIVTKELRPFEPPVTIGEIADGVREFLAYALAHPTDQFMVTPIGCGLAGFTSNQIAPLFRGAPENVKLPEVFLKVLSG